MHKLRKCNCFTVEAVVTVDVDHINSDDDSLKDVACKVNEKLKESFLTNDNKDVSENINAVMVDYSVYHNVTAGVLEFNKFKNNLRTSIQFL